MKKRVLKINLFSKTELNNTDRGSILGGIGAATGGGIFGGIGGEPRSDRRTGSCAYSRRNGLTYDICTNSEGQTIRVPTGCIRS